MVMQLGLIMVVVYLFSAYYHQAMLKTLLEEEELFWDDKRGRESYIEVLKNMAYEENEQLSHSKDGGATGPGSSNPGSQVTAAKRLLHQLQRTLSITSMLIKTRLEVQPALGTLLWKTERTMARQVTYWGQSKSVAAGASRERAFGNK